MIGEAEGGWFRMVSDDSDDVSDASDIIRIGCTSDGFGCIHWCFSLHKSKQLLLHLDQTYPFDFYRKSSFESNQGDL